LPLSKNPMIATMADSAAFQSIISMSALPSRQ